MRTRRSVSVVVLVALALVGTGLLSSPADAGSGSETRFVSNEAEYRSALTNLSSTALGPAFVILDDDVTITGATDPDYSGDQPLTIDGDGHTLSGGDTRRVITTLSAAPLLTITDITVERGLGQDGGAVNWPGSVTVTDATFSDNHSSGAGNSTGGAIHAGPMITVTNSVFSDNSATATTGNANGGAIFANDSGSADITDSVFARNTATAVVGGAHGGALFTIDTADIEGSVFHSNQATGVIGSTGGAIHSSGVVDLGSSLITRNGLHVTGSGSADGGGINGAVVTVTDTTVSNNDLESVIGSNGSAIASTGNVDLTDATVTDNGTPGEASSGAISSPDVTAVHATIASNIGTPANLATGGTTSFVASVIGDPLEGTNCNVGTVTASASVADDNTCELPGGGSNLSNAADLLLGPARDNGGAHLGPAGDAWARPTRYPLSGSPAVDRQGLGGCTDTLDQRAITRPFGPKCDAGAIEATYPPHAFTDVGAWVEDAVRWLASDVNDPPLVVGITPDRFRPEDPIIRAQVVRMLYRLAGAPDVSGYPPHPFTDVPTWVEDAVRWAYGEEIVTGETPTLFAPLQPITRGQVVRMVYRFAGSQSTSGIDPHPFTDVPDWVEDAVRWAANPDNALPIVTGITPTRFEAAENITRGQVARMVYRLAITPAAWEDPEAAPGTVPFIALAVP